MSLLETGKPTPFSDLTEGTLAQKTQGDFTPQRKFNPPEQSSSCKHGRNPTGLLQFDCFLGKNKGERGQNRFREHCLGIRTVPQESEIGSHSFIILYAGRRDTKRDSLQFAGGQNMEADQLANQANLVRDFSKDIQIDLQSTWNLRRQAREQTAHLAFLENQRRRSDH